VTALQNPPNGCSTSGQTGWGTWSVRTETQFATGTIPQNGSMFFEDNLWVRGHINGVRVTIASGRFPDNPSTRSNIIVNNDITYANFNSSDTIALISQNNINMGLQSENDLVIDAALMAQNGWVGRYSYNGCGTSSTRATFTSFGIMGTNLRPALIYSGSDGYQSRTYNYDSNLLYAPPPNFPFTSDEYSQISWTEIQ
jgi:hypothetical protein